MKKTGLDQTLATLAFRHVKGRKTLLLSLILISSLLSGVMSNTAATYVMMPIVLSLVSGNSAEGLLLALVASTAIGGSLTLIGTPPNLIVSSFIKTFTGNEMDFSRWLVFGFPTWIFGMVVVFFITLPFLKTEWNPSMKEGVSFSMEKLKTLFVISGVVGLWATSKLIGINNGIIALLGILSFLLLNILKPQDILRLRWDLVILFGGGLTLGKALMTSGWADWLVGKIPLPKNDLELFVLLTSLLLLGTVFSSHTSAAAFIGPVMIPLGMAVAPSFGTSPEVFGTLLVMMTTLSINNAMALPISTPPSAIVFSSGKVRISRMTSYGLIFGTIMNIIFVFLLKKIWMGVSL